MPELELAGKVALVTGASRGIGRSVALALGQLGATVAVNYQSSEAAAAEVCGLIKGKTKAYRADVSNEAQALAMVAEIEKDLGKIQILINNAGITRDKSFLKMTHQMWDEVLNVNLTGPYNITHAVLPGMVELGWGRIVSVSSVVGQTGSFGQVNYAATKGGIIAFTKALAREVAKKGVTVNAVAPGYIETDMTKDMPPAVLDQVKGTIPVGRMGKAEEIAAAVAFLASPAASYVTGQVLAVNGGFYM